MQLSKPLQSLIARTPKTKDDYTAWILGIVIAAITPVTAVLLGGILEALIAGGNSVAAAENAQEASRFAWLIPDPLSVLPGNQAPLVQVTVLLVISGGILVLGSVLLWAFYRRVHGRAVAFEVEVMEILREHSKNLARVRTLSAQQQALTDGLNYHLPRVRACLMRWWRTFPRHLFQALFCVLVAFLIEPTLATLALIGTCLTAAVYRFVDRAQRTALPVVRERATQLRGGLVEQSLRGPLLESVHEEHDLSRRFQEQLQHYRKDAMRSLTSSVWKTPLLTGIGGVLVALFLFVVAVQFLSDAARFSLGGGAAFLLCCVAAAVSTQRLLRAQRDMKTTQGAADELATFMALQVDGNDNEEQKPLERVLHNAEMDHVTVQDSRGRKLLDNVSVKFEPGRLIGVVSSQSLQANALVELLLGYGRPVSGRLLIDGEVVNDLRPDNLAKCSHWVAADGAIVTGTVNENLVGAKRKIDPALIDETASATYLREALQQLPEGFATVISPDDDRLTVDAAFRIALTRAALRDPSILVIDEPASVGSDQDAEGLTLRSIQALVKHSCITVVLPKRIATLRACDEIVMLHDYTVADLGTHADLLQRNDLYRHLNYLRFNAYRNNSQE